MLSYTQYGLPLHQKWPAFFTASKHRACGGILQWRLSIPCGRFFSGPPTSFAPFFLCRFFISDQRFSIGSRLGLIPGHPPKSCTPWSGCHFFVDAALCAGAPSFIRVKSNSLHHFCPLLKTELFLLLTLISKRLDLEWCGLRHCKDLSFFFPTITDFLSFE